jgi:electron transport complex protein RnfG
MVGVGLACAVVVVTVFELTRPRIETNRSERLRAAIEEVVPGSVTVRSYRRVPGAGFEPLDAVISGDNVVHAALDGEGRLVGFALEGRGQGYQDTIELLLGYDPGSERATGIAVLASRETPGLGDRIRSESFLQGFRGLDARLNKGGTGLAQVLRVERPGKPAESWELDGITGATVSSQAVARIATEALERWVPALRADRARFAGAKP